MQIEDHRCRKSWAIKLFQTSYKLKNIVIFASGTGTNAREIIHYFRRSERAGVKMILTSRRDAGVVGIAEKEGIPARVIDRENFYHSDEYVQLLLSLPADLIVLAGFLWKVPDNLIRAFPGRIINIHPALLPKFGGRGMYGHHVHEAVLAAGEKESGITIHYVNERYDEGEIILQKTVPVERSDTPEKLAQKVQQLEHQWFPVTVAEVLFSQ